MSIDSILTPLASGFLKIESVLDKSRSDKGMVLVIGNTGAGKSSLINYLAGKTFERVPDGIGSRVYVTPRWDHFLQTKPITLIGQTDKSGTDIPEIYSDASMHFDLCDCPGFFDTRGAVAEIVNAVGLKKILQKKPIKGVVLCVEYASLINMRGNGLNLAIERTIQCLGKEILVNNSLFLLITKAEQGISNFPDTLKTLSEKSAFISQLNQRGMVGFYNPVDAEKSPDGFLKRTDLLRKISSLSPLPKETKARLSISEEAIRYISQLLDWAYGYSRELMQKRNYQQLESLTQALKEINKLDLEDQNIKLKYAHFHSRMAELIESLQLADPSKEEFQILMKVLPEYESIIRGTRDKCEQRKKQENEKNEIIRSLEEKLSALQRNLDQSRKLIDDERLCKNSQDARLKALESSLQSTQNDNSRLNNEIRQLRDSLSEAIRERDRYKRFVDSLGPSLMQGLAIRGPQNFYFY